MAQPDADSAGCERGRVGHVSEFVARGLPPACAARAEYELTESKEVATGRASTSLGKTAGAQAQSAEHLRVSCELGQAVTHIGTAGTCKDGEKCTGAVTSLWHDARRERCRC